MQVQITALHDLKLTPALTQYVNDKFKKLKKLVTSETVGRKEVTTFLR